MTPLKWLAALGAVAALLFLAAFGVVKQDVADPITTSSLPQPDWLFLLFFQVTRYCRDGLEMAGVFWIPLAVVLGLSSLPFVDRGRNRTAGRGNRSRWIVFPLCLALVIVLGVFTAHTGGTTPVNSCGACHKEGFGQQFAATPVMLAEFSTRYDNNWLALHYRYPQYFWMMDADVPAW